jgi:hypothetical protein
MLVEKIEIYFGELRRSDMLSKIAQSSEQMWWGKNRELKVEFFYPSNFFNTIYPKIISNSTVIIVM